MVAENLWCINIDVFMIMSSKNQIDVNLFTDKTKFLRLKILRLRTLYLTVDSEIVVRCEGELRKVYILPDGLFACFLTDAVFQEKNCRRVKSSEIENNEIDVIQQSSRLFKFSSNGGIKKTFVTQNSLGTYLYFNGTECQFTSLLIDLDEARLPKIISWEDGCFEEKQTNLKFDWRAKFAPSLNVYRLYKQVSEILSYMPEEQKNTQILEHSEKTQKGIEASVLPVSAETNDDAVKASSKISSERVGKPEKFMREVIHSLLPNLALHPEIARMLVKKVESVGPLFSILEKLNSGETVPFKKISASAGQNGWREVNDHVSNGRRKSLRIYFRKNNRSLHRLDVFIENKTNKTSQNKTFERLAKMRFFENREVIFQ